MQLETEEEMRLRMQEFYANFDVTPAVEIRGVVIHEASCSRGQELWMMTFELAAWRIEGGPTQTQPLRIHLRGTEEELNQYSHQVKAFNVVALRARVIYDTHIEYFIALSEEFVGLDDSDDELNALAHQLRQPVYLDLPPFPRLRLFQFSCEGSVTLNHWSEFHVVTDYYQASSSRRHLGDDVTLFIEGTEKKIETLEDRFSPPTTEQTAAFQYLLDNESLVFNLVLQAIFEEYPKLQEAYDFVPNGHDEEEKAEVMPDIERPEQLKTLIRLERVDISSGSKDGVAYMGFNFRGAWDPEHGFGVAIHKDRLMVVGDPNCALAFRRYE